MPKKACLIDISRFRVPKLSRMKQMIEKIAAQGYNQIFFNIEHSFKFKSHPLIGMEADGYTGEEFKELDLYAIENKIELIPVIQSFGHMFHILKWHDYEYLSETESKWSVKLANETYEFFDQIYQELSEAFSSEYFHIGGDEVYDLAAGKTATRLTEFSKNELFMEHIIKLKELANKYHKKVIVWADMIDKDPHTLEKLGNDTLICYWMYDLKTIPSQYAAVSSNLYICPGTNTWKSLFPRATYAQKNFKLKSYEYKKFNPYGFMVTDWGDAGHLHPISFTEKMFEIALAYFEKEKVELEFENEIEKRIFNLLDEINHPSYLADQILNGKSEYLTKLFLHDYIFGGTSLQNQTTSALKELTQKSVELQILLEKLETNSEFSLDLAVMAKLSLLMLEKVSIHLAYRLGGQKQLLIDMIEKFIVEFRKWIIEFANNWQRTSQPMGLFFHFHFFNKIITDLLEEIENLKTNKIVKRTIYGKKEYAPLFSVSKLNYLWDNYRL